MIKCSICGNTKLRQDHPPYLSIFEVDYDTGKRYICIPEYRTVEQKFAHKLKIIKHGSALLKNTK